MSQTLPPSAVQTLDNLLHTAFSGGRKTLYEHEVYLILEELGLRSPAHAFIRHENEITPSILSLFSSEKVVLKAAAPGMAHKLREGGVQIAHKDLDFIRYCFGRMRRSLEEKGYGVEGVLLAEYVPYSKDLGNEVLLGFRESEAFGPVLSFSKGGSDTEHFAENFSAPNLILAPIDREWAYALLKSTRIHKKYVAEGHADYIRKIVEAGVRLSMLATCFSDFFPGDTRYVLKEFEVNPFVFDPYDRFFALDGFAAFDCRRGPGSSALESGPEGGLTPFFEPEGIAVVGISRTGEMKAGNVIARNLFNMGRSDVYCVNPSGGEVEIAGRRRRLYAAVSGIEEHVDLAVVAVAAEQSLEVVEDCAAKGVRALVLISGGFSESRKNFEIEGRIAGIARQRGIRLIGPNCLGILYIGDGENPGVNTFFIPEKKFSPSLERDCSVAILSQSGALGITEIYNLRHAISPKVIVSYGNQLDVDAGDLVRYFDEDRTLNVIGCYIEGFRKGAGRKFFDIASRAKKPVIVYKAGRTEAGRKATESHTASMAGEYEVAKAALKQAGLVVTDTMIDHGDFIKTFALLHDFEVQGNRVAIIANAGYEKTYAADNLGGLVLAEFDEPTVRALAGVLPSYVTIDPLLDLTPMAGDDMFERCIDTVLGSGSVDALFVSIVPQSGLIHTTDEEIDGYGENIAARVVRLLHRHRKPLVVSVNVVSGADAVYNKLGQILDSGGVPTFLEAKRAMICLNAFVRYRMTKESKAFSEWLK